MIGRQVSVAQPAAYPPARVQVFALQPRADSPVNHHHVAFRQPRPRRTAVHRRLAHICARNAHQPNRSPFAVHDGRLLISFRCELISGGGTPRRIALQPQLRRVLLERQCATCCGHIGRRPDRHLHRVIGSGAWRSAQYEEATELGRILSAVSRPRIGKHSSHGRAVHSERQIAVEPRFPLCQCTMQARCCCDCEKNCCSSGRPHDRKPNRSRYV